MIIRGSSKLQAGDGLRAVSLLLCRKKPAAGIAAAGTERSEAEDHSR